MMKRCSPPAGVAVSRAAAAALLALSILGGPAGAQATGDPDRPPRADAPEAESAPPDVDLTGPLLYQIVAAELALQRGDAGAAFATYLSVARQTRDARIARRAAEIAVAGRAGPQALEATALWRELAPGSREARQAHAFLLTGSGRLEQAEPLFAAGLRESAQPAAELAQIQRALARVDDRPAAFAMLERLAAPLLAQPATAVDAQLTLAAAALQAGLSDRALASARAALELRPDDERTVLLADGQRAAAVGQFEQALAQDATDPDALFALGVLALEDRPPRRRARGYFESYLDVLARTGATTHDPDPAYLNLARIAEDERRFEEALKWLAEVDDGPQAFTARMRQAIVLAKMQRVEEARRLLAETPAAGDGQRQQLTLTEAQVLREARRFEESYQLLAAALAQSPDDTALLYDAAMAAERLGRVDEMERLLRRLMQLRPDEPHAYNALGYTFADRNQRLPEAYELIDRALKLAPDDAHIIDSMGWVYFRMGNLARAREFLERAFALRPEAEIGAHLGEVLWTLGERDAARRIWRQVRADEPDNETLSATLARLQVRL
ncbi:MAG: tetratricopeptide repeat protein [Burkholderiaceae bacterium]|nr:tetratricopeptide repeat protein [Burkholderiaceae bacterium]